MQKEVSQEINKSLVEVNSILRSIKYVNLVISKVNHNGSQSPYTRWYEDKS